MKDFFRFIASPDGRMVRVMVGLTLIGVSVIGKRGINKPLLLVALAPLSAGLFDICLLAPLAGKPLSGEKLRAQVN